MLRLRLALNAYAFHWAFPEIVADENGLFGSSGVEVAWEDVTPGRATNKTALYTDLLREKKTDVYHAGEWACINRVAKADDSWIAAKSDPGRGTLNSTFSIYVRRDAGIRRPADLAGEGIAIEAGTGSYYTALQDLERFVPRDSVKLVQMGEPHKRLVALLRGEVKAASLVGPWPAIGEVFGLSLLLKTRRTNPTTIVVRKDMDRELFRRFMTATNQAIRVINRDPDRFKGSQFRRVARILEEMPPEFRKRGKEIEENLTVPRWKPWSAYTKTEFSRTSRWMSARNLLTEAPDPDGSVANYPRSLYR